MASTRSVSWAVKSIRVTYRWENIGRPGCINLGKSGRENDAWFPEYVQLYDQHNDTLYTCPVNEWFPQESLTRYYSRS